MGSDYVENGESFIKNMTEQLSIETLIKEADLVLSNDYSQVCKYKCALCNKFVDRLRTHMIRNHKDTVNTNQIPKKNYHNYKEVFHKCGLCEKIIIFTRTKLRNHIIKSHEMTINEYNKLFMKPQKILSIKKNKPQNLKTKERVNSRTKSTKKHLPHSSKILSSNYSEVCKYLCPVCNKLVDRLRTHMVRYHPGHQDQIGKHAKTNFHKEIYHKCGVCDKIIIFTRQKITYHILNAHKMSIDEYDSQFMNPKISQKSKILDILGEGYNYIYDKNRDKSLLSNRYKDLCKVNCKMCRKNIDVDLFQFHLSKKHGLAFTNYKETHGMPVVTRRSFHKCGICGFVVLFTRFKLTRHATKAHQLSMKDYASRFIKETIKGEGQYQKAPKWCDGSRYKCPFCHNIYYRYNSFRLHLIKCHDIKNFKERKSMMDNSLIFTDTYNCKICGQSLRKEKMHIETHINHVHKTTYRLYEDNLENGQVMDVEAVVAKLIREGIASMPNKLPNKRRIIRFEDIETRPSQLLNEDTKPPPEFLISGEDDFKNVMLNSLDNGTLKKEIKQEYEDGYGIKGDPSVEKLNKDNNSIKKETLHSQSFIEDTKPPPEFSISGEDDCKNVMMKSLANIPLKKKIKHEYEDGLHIRGDPPARRRRRKLSENISSSKFVEKLNKDSHSINKIPSNNTIGPLPQNYPKVRHLKTVKEVATMMFTCPIPGCRWTCTKEKMKNGPAVLHLVRLHRIPPMEIRKRRIKLLSV